MLSNLYKKYYYKQCIDKETLKREYKVFSYNFIDIDNIDTLENLKTGKWIYNSVTEYTLKKYIKIYLPRYIASFSNPNTLNSQGEFYIGVDDDGIVHGIPYDGLLDINLIKNEIKSIFEDKIKNGKESEECLDEYFKLIKIELFELNIRSKCDYYNYYEHYLNRITNQNRIYENYLKAKKIWENVFNMYVLKLHDIANNSITRLELINFIRENCKEKLVMYELLIELRSDKIYKQVTFDMITKNKDNKLNMFYWIIKYKDYIVSRLKKMKPIIPKLYYNQNYPLQILCNVPNMIPTWINNNKSLKLYLIKFTLPGNISKTKYLEYKDNVTGEFISSYRTDYNGIPRCER